MKDIIKSCEVQYQLYKEPAHIGEIIQIGKKQEDALIIGIELVRIVYTKLVIRYICQIIKTDHVYQPKSDAHLQEKLTAFTFTIQTGKERLLEKITLGRMFWDENDYPYQAVSYKDVTIKGCDVVVSFYARPIKPMKREEAKALLVSSKKRKLNLEVISTDDV